MSVEPIRPPGYQGLVELLDERTEWAIRNTEELAGAVLDYLEAAGWTAPGTPEPTAEPCGHQYMPRIVCTRPAGHVVENLDADTWHRDAHVRWNTTSSDPAGMLVIR